MCRTRIIVESSRHLEGNPAQKIIDGDSGNSTLCAWGVPIFAGVRDPASTRLARNNARCHKHAPDLMDQVQECMRALYVWLEPHRLLPQNQSDEERHGITSGNWTPRCSKGTAISCTSSGCQSFNRK